MAPLSHIVCFKFHDGLQQSVVDNICQTFIGLKEECKKEDGSTYILSLTGGRNNSPEGKDKGLQYGFIAHFATEADREWYLKKDPAHLAFGKLVRPNVSDSFVLDFYDGVF